MVDFDESIKSLMKENPCPLCGNVCDITGEYYNGSFYYTFICSECGHSFKI